MIREIEEERTKNFEDKVRFLKFYINWMKGTPNQIWSKQQADFIDSQFMTSNQKIRVKPDQA